MSEKYSVLMSVYKKENPDFVVVSIASMLKQTLPPEQIVLVKDGKLTNKLDSVIEKYHSKYPELFTIVSLEKNIGLGLALNEGLKHCRNELVARMDTDDISLPTRCEKQVKHFNREKELSLLGTNILEFYDNPEDVVSSRNVPSTHDEIISFSKRRNPFNHPSMMYKRSDVLNSGGYGDFRRNQDYDLFIRMLNNGYQAANINEPLLLFRANKDNDKRRKSWERVQLDISLRYRFWKKGYHSFMDFVISSSGLIILYISPSSLFTFISSKFLRKKVNE